MPTKTSAAPVLRFIPQERFDTVQYVEEDAPEGTIPFEAKIRSNLTHAEVNALVWENETSMTDLHEMFAPYVVEWNLSGIDAKGKEVDIPAPADGGGEQFDYLPSGMFWALVRDIKLRSTRPLDPKRNAPSSATPAPSNANGES